MNLLLIYSFFHVLNIVVPGSPLFKICYGGKVEDLPMGCEEVIGFPLVISDYFYDIDAKSEDGRKLSTIQRITNGIVLRDNNFKRFSALTSLEYLTVLSGEPLLKLERNHQLMSMEFKNLRVINGTMPLVTFWNDNYPIEMRRSNRVLQKALDIFRFQEFQSLLATAGHAIDPCSANYFDFHSMQEESAPTHWYFVLAGSLGALAIAMIADVLWYMAFQRRWERQLLKLEIEREAKQLNIELEKSNLYDEWRMDCIKIADEEHAWMNDFARRTQDDPYHAPGEEKKWAEERRKLRKIEKDLKMRKRETRKRAEKLKEAELKKKKGGSKNQEDDKKKKKEVKIKSAPKKSEKKSAKKSAKKEQKKSEKKVKEVPEKAQKSTSKKVKNDKLVFEEGSRRVEFTDVPSLEKEKTVSLEAPTIDPVEGIPFR